VSVLLDLVTGGLNSAGCWFSLVSAHLLVCWVPFVSSCLSDSGCRVASLLNPFTGPLLEKLLALFLTFTQMLVSCSPSSSTEHLQREVLHDYPVVKGGLSKLLKGFVLACSLQT